MSQISLDATVARYGISKIIKGLLENTDPFVGGGHEGGMNTAKPHRNMYKHRTE